VRLKVVDPGFLSSVQGLRGVAAASVLLVHLYDMPKGGIYDAADPGFLPPIWPWLQSVINVGGHGVELFFMISGFLIPASLMRHGSVSKFLFDRALRIMPAYVILHLALFVVGPMVGYKFFRDIGIGGYVEAFLANLLFVPELLGLPYAQQNAWTLTYEWAFYVWFAVTFGAVARLRSSALVVPLIALAVFSFFKWPMSAFFAIGMFFSVVDLRIRLTGWPGLLLALVCAATMYGTLEYLHPFYGLVPGFVLFGMVLAPGSGVSRALGGGALQFLGKISYSLYLVHPFVLFPLQIIGLKLVGHGANRWMLWAGFIVVGVAASVVVSTASYELIEIRLRRALDGALRHAIFRPLGRIERPA